MKALTLKEPWASLVVLGAKEYETRSWATKHTGRIAIHVSKTFDAASRRLCLYEPFSTHLEGFGMTRRFTLGAIIGLVTIVRCVVRFEFRHRGL